MVKHLLQSDRKGLEFSFTWLFAIIVGAFILFLAIFLSTKIIGTGQQQIDAQTGKEFGVLLNPLETGFISAKSTSVTMPVKSRVYNSCDLEGDFGRQLLKVSQKSFNEWTNTDVNVVFRNKYLFSEKYAEGKKYFIFSKPFEFPFKVADLMIVTPADKKYCFSDVPKEIKEELLAINQENFYVENCSDKNADVDICFGVGNCDVNVNYNSGVVEKTSETFYFESDALMFAAIFSEKGIYECQIKRLMMRTSNLAEIYKDKASFVSRVGCDSNLNTDLVVLQNLASSLKDSGDLSSITSTVNEIKQKNDLALCKLW